MASRLINAVPSTNGKARAKRSKQVPTTVEAGVSKARRWITLGMGCGIPLGSLALSSIGGRLCSEGHEWLGGAVLVLCGAVLTVSLSHLAWAIGDITRSSRWQSWCMAIAVDVSLIACELSCVAGAGWWLISAVMAAVTVASAVLNCWAFTQH